LLALLGLPLWIEAVRAVLNNPLVLAQHANVRFPPWVERLNWILITPGMHRVHHSIDRRDYDLNFGGLFSWWDRLFGTWREAGVVERVGLPGFENARWQTLPGMLAAPLR
jgi:sterol desaturase/sphingolipid hydroxylase (fatty acid hydroxylase superfamily)